MSALSVRRTAGAVLQVDRESGQDIRTDLARTVVNEGWGLLELQAENMSLEDIFIKLTTAEETTPTTAS